MTKLDKKLEELLSEWESRIAGHGFYMPEKLIKALRKCREQRDLKAYAFVEFIGQSTISYSPNAEDAELLNILNGGAE